MNTSTSTKVRARSAAVGGAIGAALAIWFIAEILFDVNLRSPAAGGAEAQDVAAINVVFAAAVASLAGWALLAVLERLTSRPRLIWTAIAVVMLLVSLAGPLSGTGVTTTNRLVLVLLHLVVGAVVITILAKTAKTTKTSR